MSTTPANPAAGSSLDSILRDAAPARKAAPSTARGTAALLETTKPGITRLVTLTSAVGFLMVALVQASGRSEGVTLWAHMGGWWFVLNVLGCLAGTALCAAGANTINQWMEHTRDARMPRTQNRPIPSGRSEASRVLWFGVGTSVVGLGVLWTLCGWLPMLVSMACLVSYLVMYTPLKPLTPLATFVGALPGALPPMIGASAASHHEGWLALREPAGLALFAIMFVWQIPHFLALAWLYRDDYAKGGFAVLPVMDERGVMTVWTVALWSVVLVAASVIPAAVLPSVLGVPFVVLAVVTGLAFLWPCARLMHERTRTRARAVFLASVLHLPVLLLGMVAEASVRALL